jgi:retron-type reverse transcriptase
MRTDHLKGWLAAATKEERPDRTQWDVLVTLVGHMWQTGELPTVLPWSTMVLLPKPDGSSRGIGLLEVLSKLLTSIIDGRLKAAIAFHDALHGFWPRRGTTTAIIEAKLFQQLALIQQVPIFEIFIDLKKAYDTLDRERTLEILEHYGVGALTLQLLRQFWDRQLVVAKQGGHFGMAFPATRGVMQGDIVSPTIFNIVVDAIVRHWLNLVLDDGSEVNGFGRTVREQLVLFYADDGLLAARNHL